MSNSKNKNKNKIIIINDNQEISLLFKQNLTSNLFDIVIYENYAEVKKQSKNNQESNLVFFNPYLGKKHKNNLIADLKAIFPNSILIAIYDFAKETDLAEWLNQGIAGFIAKDDLKEDVLINLINDLNARFNITSNKKRSYDVFDGVLACSRDAIFVLLPVKEKTKIIDFKIIVANLEAGITFSKNPSQLEGEKLSTIIDFNANPFFVEKLKKVFIQKERLDLEFKVDIGTKEKWLYARALKAKTGLILSIADISLRRNFVKALREIRDHSDEIDVIKNKALAEIAEEYSSDVEEIVSLSEFIKKEVHGSDISSYAKYISEINSKALDLSKSFGTISEKIKVAKKPFAEQGFMQHIPHMVCLCKGGEIKDINVAGVKKLGFTSSKKIIGKNFTSFVDEISAKKIVSGFEVIAFKNKPVLMTFKTNKGKSFDAEVSAIRYHSEQPNDFIMVSVRDVSFRNKVTENIKRVEERLAIILDKATDAIILTNAYGKIEIFNQSATNIFGYSLKEVLGKPLTFLFDDSSKVMGKLFSYGGDIIKEALCVKKNQEKFWGEVVFSEVGTASGNHIITLVRDVSKQKQTEEKLTFLTTRDSLTGLFNREFFKTNFEDLVTSSKFRSRKFGAILVDIDRFRNISDTLGQLIGEKVLIKTAERLRSFVSKKDVVARFSGDEFILLVNNSKNLKKLVEDIGCAIARPFEVEGKEIFISASIGVLKYPDDANNFDQMIRHLETSLRIAKAKGVGSYQFYNAEMSINTQRKVLIENEIRKALEKGEFTLVYQPKVDIISGVVTGAEALIRWKNDVLGTVSPVEFIPVAEDSGFIIAIGEWVMGEVCNQIGCWQRKKINFGRIAINLSARQFNDLELTKKVADIFKKAGIDSNHVELELTETILAQNPDDAIRTLKSLKDMGIKVAIDDFGMGYSSLGYLKKFPIDCLKIDREFVKDLPDDADDVAITLSIISLARHLGMKLVAEGVETIEQLNFLKEHQCDEAQGYYLSYPIDADAITKLLGHKISKL